MWTPSLTAWVIATRRWQLRQCTLFGGGGGGGGGSFLLDPPKNEGSFCPQLLPMCHVMLKYVYDG